MDLHGMLILLLTLSFLGGFVGSIMSGGSIIIFTALTFSEVPVKTAVGTLKFAIAVLGLFSAGAYLRGGAVNVKLTSTMLLSTVVGSALGSQIILSLPEKVLRVLVTSLICVGTILSLRLSPKPTPIKNNKKLRGTLSVVGGIILGAYIGMLGVASAILTISLLIALFRLPLLEANGTAKVIIFFNNLVACVVYALHNSVDFFVGIPISIPIAVGAWVGAKTAMRMGSSRLRIVFVGAAVVTAVKLLTETI